MGQEGEGTRIEAQRKRTQRRAPGPKRRKGKPQGRDQHRPTPSEHRTTPGGAGPQNTPRRHGSDAVRSTPAHAHQLPETTQGKEGTRTRGERATPTEEAAENTAAKPTPTPSPEETTLVTARANSQAPEEEEGAATAPSARGEDHQRTRDQTTGPQGGQPRGHLPDPPARAARPDPHSTDPPSHPSPNRTPQPPASHTPTRTPHHDTGRTDLHRRTTAQHEAARHTARQHATMQRTMTRHPKAQHATARRDATRHRAAHHGTTRRSTTRPTRAHRNTARTRTTQHGKTRHGAARRTTAHHDTKARDANRGSNQNKPLHDPGRRRSSTPHAGKGPPRARQQQWRSAHTNRRQNVNTATAQEKGLRPLTQGCTKTPGATAQPAEPAPSPAGRAAKPEVYITRATHGAGARPRKKQAPTTTRKTTPNADGCVHQPREGRGRNRQPPPQKKRKKTGGGGHEKGPQPQKHPPTPQEAAEPPSQTAPETGLPEGQPEDHQARTGNTKPGAASHRKKRHPKHADTHHTGAKTKKGKKKKHTKTQPKREGKGGRRPRDPRPGQPATDTTKPRQDTPRRPPQRKPKGEGGGHPPLMTTPAHTHATGGHPR